METVQTLASEVLKLPSCQADKQTIKKQLTELYNDWDDICQQVSFQLFGTPVLLFYNCCTVYSGKLSREKTFANFAAFFSYERKCSLRLFEGSVDTVGTSEQSTKVFSAKFHFSTNLRKFSPTNDSRYMVVIVIYYLRLKIYIPLPFITVTMTRMYIYSCSVYQLVLFLR